MALNELLMDDKLTDLGQSVAHDMFIKQCDRIPCYGCSCQNRETKGPAGPGCKAPQLSTRAEVDQVLTVYMNRPPGLESHISTTSSILRRLA